MRSLRQILMMIALVAVALLPGPSHALAAASSGHDTHAASMPDHVGRVRHAHAGAGHSHAAPAVMAADRQHPSASHHRPCKACSVACCAPATAAVSARLIVVVRMHRTRPVLPVADRLLAGATPRLALKPPTLSA